jgi:hypothetical protein
MTIRKNVRVFVDGSLRTVDLDENGRIVGKPQEDEVANPANMTEDQLLELVRNKGITKRKLMALLKEKGIKFPATLSSEALVGVLFTDGNDSKSDIVEKDVVSGGTGNTEVI